MAHQYNVGDIVNIKVDVVSKVAAKSESLSPGDLEEAEVVSTVDHQNVMGEEVCLYDVQFVNADLTVNNLREAQIDGLVA